MPVEKLKLFTPLVERRSPGPTHHHSPHTIRIDLPSTNTLCLIMYTLSILSILPPIA